MYIQRTSNKNFLALLLIVAAVIIVMFHTRPAKNNTDGLEATVAKMEEEVAGLIAQQEGQAVPGVLTEVEKKELNTAIPLGLEQDILLSDIHDITTKADVTFNALTFSLQKIGGIPAINITGGFQGPSGNITRFLKLIESNPRKILIKDASVSRSASTSNLDFMNLNITMQSFYRDN